MPRFCRVFVLLFSFAACSLARADTSSPPAAEFVLADQQQAIPFWIEASTDRAIARAADDVRSDIARVADARPALLGELPTTPPRQFVLAGVVGHSAAIDQLARSGRLDLSALRGAWESFVLATVENPFPGVDRALIVAGSDRRGAIYGLYEISAAIGVSPWHWWADVTPPPRTRLALPGEFRRFGPPSVKYRGIFLNDEDWGLQPWAAKTFEPETGDIGPKTYARLFELLLRLKANTVWPAMHPTTRAFNHYPRNKEVADAYGIVMGSSHAEPMLRNNVDEWTAPKEDYNYVTNRAGVLRYWEQRVAENGRYENIYTLGMRGIHDSNMQGPTTDAQRIRILEQVFADQRALIARYVRPDVTAVPQMFCAYKEVLDLYRQGLRVPDDVTIVSPDDNFGYIRHFLSPTERTRPGGGGVYYHLSYLGRPLSYLWLGTTPPALIWTEMHKAFEHGADRIWIANVGDLKPAEIGTEFFLQLAWDIRRWQPDTLPQFLEEWAAREFGADSAQEIAAILNEFYVLNFARKPEHLQWWLPREPRRFNNFTDAEIDQRLAAFSRLSAHVAALRARMAPSRQDAFYELVYYPVVGAALANERFFAGERGALDVARSADARLIAETRYFNEELAGGKWRGFMTLEPASNEWASMRIAPWSPPAEPRPAIPTPAPGTRLTLDAAEFVSAAPRGGAVWTVVPGLGRSGRAATPLPTTFASVNAGDATASAPRLDYSVTFPAAGTFRLELELLPTHPLDGQSQRLAVALDDQPPVVITLGNDDGSSRWAQGVLSNVRTAATSLNVTRSGAHTLRLFALDPGIVLDRLSLDLDSPQP